MHRVFLNVGYELSERQLRAHFATYGVLSDMYLPKHTNGRNKGYGFATFASEHSLSLVLQQPKHVINGITVQVSHALACYVTFNGSLQIFRPCQAAVGGS